MKISVKVPATTANIGPGFDSFGMAIPIYNIITIEETVLGGVEIELISKNDDIQELHLPADDTNIIYGAIEQLYACVGQAPSAIKVTIDTNIPIAKGLGSSASVIVGSLIAANELLGRPADLDALLSIANEVEGHPDNITPAFLGGFCISSLEEDGSIKYCKLDWPKNWKLTLCVPDFELSTSISRSVLPEQVSREDAVFNIRRAAMLVHAIHTQDSELMKLAMQDKLHQPYRIRFVPGLEDVMTELRAFDNVLGVALSGAGPSILVISAGNNLDKIIEVIKTTWEKYSVKANINTFDIDTVGAEILTK
ncbi:MAG: homoserine kinase [bacterium]